MSIEMQRVGTRYEPFYTQADRIAIGLLLPLMGSCEQCQEFMGNRRYPLLANMHEAVRLSYISCQPCYNATWAGEA